MRRAGIVAAPVPFTFTLATKAPTLTLTSPSGGTLTKGTILAGSVTTDAGVPLVCLCYSFDGSTTMVPVAFADGSFNQVLDLSRIGRQFFAIALVTRQIREIDQSHGSVGQARYLGRKIISDQCSTTAFDRP